jgi:hypothetical protein
VVVYECSGTVLAGKFPGGGVRQREQQQGFTERQIELIRTRLEAYKISQIRAPKKLSWGGLVDEIFEKTGILMDDEVPRQFVRQTKRRGTVRMPEITNLHAMASFLMNDEINMLSRKELEEPEIPYRFAEFLLDYLGPNPEYRDHSSFKALGGTYIAIDKSPEFHRIIDLKLEIKDGDRVIRITERMTAYHQIESGDTVDNSKIIQLIDSEGWAVLGPDQNLFMFVKAKRYGYCYYYLTMAMDKNVRYVVPVDSFLLLRHHYPIQSKDLPETFEEVTEESDGYTRLLHFDRVGNVDAAKERE